MDAPLERLPGKRRPKPLRLLSEPPFVEIGTGKHLTRTRIHATGPQTLLYPMPDRQHRSREAGEWLTTSTAGCALQCATPVPGRSSVPIDRTNNTNRDPYRRISPPPSSGTDSRTC